MFLSNTEKGDNLSSSKKNLKLPQTNYIQYNTCIFLIFRYGGYLVKVNGYNDNNWFGKLITAHNISDVWLGKVYSLITLDISL